MVTDPLPGTEMRAALAHRAVWRLLVKGLEAFLPERAAALRLEDVRLVSEPSDLVGFAAESGGAVAFHSEPGGFGVHLRARERGPEPEREIFVRGREGQPIGSIGLVVVGSSPDVGTRVLDASRLFRYARSLTFSTLFLPSDSGSVVAAVQAARAVENVIYIDLALGIGLGAELDLASRQVSCPLLVRFGARSSVSVLASVSAAAAPRRSA